MPKKKMPELDPKEQFKRFEKAAKDAGIDDDGKRAMRSFRSLIAGQKPKKPTS